MSSTMNIGNSDQTSSSDLKNAVVGNSGETHICSSSSTGRTKPAQEQIVKQLSSISETSNHIPSSSTDLSKRPLRITMAGMIYDANHCLERALDPRTSGLHPGLFEEDLLGIGFYTVWEAGLIFSGNVGTGIVFARNPTNGTWSAPAAVGLSGIGWGLMGGASRKTIVYLIYDYYTLQSMSGEHGAMLRAQAETSLFVWGRTAERSAIVTARGIGTNIAVSYSRGIFGGISIEGALCKGRNRVNERFYGRKVSTADILFSGKPLDFPSDTLLPVVYEKLERLCDGLSIYTPSQEERLYVKSTRQLVNKEGEEALKDEVVEYVEVPYDLKADSAEAIVEESGSSEIEVTDNMDVYAELVDKEDESRHRCVNLGFPPPLSRQTTNTPDDKDKEIVKTKGTRNGNLPAILMLILCLFRLPHPSSAWMVDPKGVYRGRMTLEHKRTQEQHSRRLFATIRKNDEDNQDTTKSGDAQWYQNLDVLPNEEGEFWYGDDKVEDWIPDAEKHRAKPQHLTAANEVLGSDDETNIKSSFRKTSKSPYTEEEEELIEALGGKSMSSVASRRQEGFLGDSTLKEIANDYSVPICYLADVLCMWQVPVPINIHERLGDMVTGEQAFALVEAIHSLDIGVLQDRYSNQSLLQVCEEWNIDVKDAFAFAMKEGWSLPFGVRTNLRVEQEDELLRVYSPLYQDSGENEEGDYY